MCGGGGWAEGGGGGEDEGLAPAREAMNTLTVLYWGLKSIEIVGYYFTLCSGAERYVGSLMTTHHPRRTYRFNMQYV